MSESDRDEHEVIKDLNNVLRKTRSGGELLIDPAVHPFYDEIMDAVANSENFDPGCDLHEDGGVVTVRGRRYRWRVDPKDKDRSGESPDAADPNVTTRVLSVYPIDDEP